MVGGAALTQSHKPPAPSPAPSQPQQQQQAKEQLQKAVAMNALRLQDIGDQIMGRFHGGLPSADLNRRIYSFARDIDYALSVGDVGTFDGNYIIAVAFVNNLTLSDVPKLNEYAQPITTDLPDSDILEGPSRVSLKCPISFRRMTTPVKGRLCKHHQCFDYDNYMEMNLKKPTWRCPLCTTPSNFIDLRNDQKMAKVLQEASDDIIDILVFPDGSWKAIHDEKSDRHAGDMIQQNGGSLDTDATPSEVIDLVNRDDEGDLPMSLASTPEDVGRGNNVSRNGTSTSGQNLLLSSTGGPGSSSFGTLESILPRDIMQMRPSTTDAVSPFGTPNLTFAMQQISQGTYPNVMHVQSQLDSQRRSEVARHAVPRYVRREPIAVQALAVTQQNSSRRVRANVLNPPSPNPQSISASWNYQAQHVTNADSVITSMSSGVGPLSRAPDGSSLLHLQSTQQDIRNMLNHARARLMGHAAPSLMHMRPPTGGSGQGRGGANAHEVPFPQQYQQHFDQRQLENLMCQMTPQGGAVSQGNLYAPQQSQALRAPRAGTPPVQPRVQSPGLPLTPPATTLVEASDAQELPNWQPTGRMRGSLVGPAYDQAIGRHLPPGGERTSQAWPPGR